MDTLCWFDVFGGLFYDALAIGLLHLEELNVGEHCLGVAIIWMLLEVFDLAMHWRLWR